MEVPATNKPRGACLYVIAVKELRNNHTNKNDHIYYSFTRWFRALFSSASGGKLRDENLF
jgi:hypothetical protein